MKIFEIMSQEQRMRIVEDLSKAIKPNISFYLMAALSAMVVTYGFLANSIALIITGIILSPLFSTVFAFSLSIIKGDIHLMRKSLHSAGSSILLGFAVAIMMTLILPNASVTPEILERIRPNIFDLIIGVAAGIGTGYLLTKENVHIFIPGVAMSILLVPPISVAGIGLTLREYNILGGASLLFATNLVALISGNSLILWLRGFVPYWSSEAHEEVKKKLIVTGLVLVLFAAPLIYIMISVINETAISHNISNVLTQQLEESRHATIIDQEFSQTKKGLIIDITLRSPKIITSNTATIIKGMLEEKLKKKVILNLNVISVKKLNTE